VTDFQENLSLMQMLLHLRQLTEAPRDYRMMDSKLIQIRNNPCLSNWQKLQNGSLEAVQLKDTKQQHKQKMQMVTKQVTRL